MPAPDSRPLAIIESETFSFYYRLLELNELSVNKSLIE